jgi:hypothetical protein
MPPGPSRAPRMPSRQSAESRRYATAVAAPCLAMGRRRRTIHFWPTSTPTTMAGEREQRRPLLEPERGHAEDVTQWCSDRDATPASQYTQKNPPIAMTLAGIAASQVGNVFACRTAARRSRPRPLPRPAGCGRCRRGTRTRAPLHRIAVLEGRLRRQHRRPDELAPRPPRSGPVVGPRDAWGVRGTPRMTSAPPRLQVSP